MRVCVCELFVCVAVGLNHYSTASELSQGFVSAAERLIGGEVRESANRVRGPTKQNETVTNGNSITASV